MRWSLARVVACCLCVFGCGDSGRTDSGGGEETESGDGDSGDGDSGDGDGDSGDGDGDSGDGDSGDGDGDGESGDGDGESGDGDGDSGDGDGESGDGDGDSGDGDGDSGDGDGDSGDGDVCDSWPDAFLGGGIAEDGWGVGDLCDEIYVCVSSIDYEQFIDLLDVECFADLSCGDGQRCVLAEQTVVDQSMMADVCTALTIANTVWCMVWGP
jgi:hypothetical protein